MEGEQFVHNHYLTRNVWSGLFFGIGLIAFIDEGVFHQLLHWHHFYDKSTLEVGLVSDGFFHAFSWFATIAGLFMVADLRRCQVWMVKRWWGGVLLGAGLFQLYDGLIQHKIFGLHQIRYVDNVIYYDWVWNATAIIMTAVGGLLLKATGKTSQNKKVKKHGE